MKLLLPILLLLLGPGVGPAAESTPQNAAEALRGFTWKLGQGELAFLPDGRVKKSWPEKMGWRWKVVGERTFIFRLAGGNGKTVTMLMSEDFSRFEGPNFRGDGKLSGTRGAPVAAEALPAPVPAPSAPPAAPPSTPSATPPASPSPPPPSATPSATPLARNTLDGLAENGPFITDQVLSALDRPSVSEATVALWKEDLLDEGARASSSEQPLYRQGALLVEAWKSALRERNQIISTSGFSGSVSDAPDMASGRKTVLHVWDWLEYARERDAAARHERKLQRTAEFFASGPPRRWAERSAVLRQQIDRLYATFRQLRRASLPEATPAP